jgi:hypothetical protein
MGSNSGYVFGTRQKKGHHPSYNILSEHTCGLTSPPPPQRERERERRKKRRYAFGQHEIQ